MVAILTVKPEVDYQEGFGFLVSASPFLASFAPLPYQDRMVNKIRKCSAVQSSR